MNKPTIWIKSHQVTAFFILTFAITWGLGFSYGAVMKQGQLLLAPLMFVATCGPALAGIIISAVSNAQPRQGTRKAFWVAFFVAWGVSTLVLLANSVFITKSPVSPALVVIGVVVVVPVAFVIGMARSRIPAVRSYLSSLIRLRGVWGWALLALMWTPGLSLISILISSQLGRQPFTAHQFQETGLVLIGLVTVKFLYQFFFFNATGEEAGWRGFALPGMQSLTSPLVACLVINIFWPLWHLFPWMAEGRSVFSPWFWTRTYLELLPATVILVWFYNRSKGSILVAGVAHAAANTAYAFLPNLDWTVFNWTVAVAALALVVVDRMWKNLPQPASSVPGSVAGDWRSEASAYE